MSAGAPPARARGASEWRFAVVVAVAFAGLAVLGVTRHEMWFDEVQAWMLSRDVGSVRELIHALHYEGHPAAWYLLLYVLGRITTFPVAMQFLNAALCTGTAFLIAWRAPFPRIWRVLLPFGYLLAYEYTLIARSYGLGVLLTFAVCALWPIRGRRLLPAALLLGVLANTSAYGALLAAALCAAILADGLWDRPAGSREMIRRLTTLGLVAGGGALVSAFVMMPPRNAPFVGDTVAVGGGGPRLLGLLSSVWRTFLPIPVWWAPSGFLHSNALLYGRGVPGLVFMAVAGAGFLAATTIAFARVRAALVLFVVYVVSHFAFALLVYSGTFHHHAHIFVAWLAALWVLRAGPSAATTVIAGRLVPATPHSPRSERLLPTLVLGVAVAQVVAFAMMYGFDLVRPFSQARGAAEYLRAHHVPADRVMGVWSTPTAAVGAFLGQPLYAADRTRTETYVHWETPIRFRDLKTAEQTALAEAGTRSVAAGGPVVLILGGTLSVTPSPDLDVRQLVSMDGSIKSGERYVLYNVSHRPSSAPPTFALAASGGR